MNKKQVKNVKEMTVYEYTVYCGIFIGIEHE